MSWKFKYYDIATGPDWEAIEKNCDWFRDMKAIPQDAIWHAEGDVQIHTIMVCEALIKLPEFIALDDQAKHIVLTSALMHDIEKRSTTAEEERDGRICIVAPRHAKRGEYTARELLYKVYDCPYEIKEKICKLVRWHGKPLYSLTDDNVEKSIVTIAEQIPMHWLAMLSKADILGRTCFDEAEQLEKIEMFKMYCEDLGCLYAPREFASELARYTYLSKGGYLDYVPFDETKFEVIMMSAIPGSGKDTYVSRNLGEYPVVSLDAIRTELKVKPTDKSGNGRVIQLGKERAKEFMRKKENFVWNATNITAQLRSQLIDLFTSYGAKVKIVYVEVPYKTLLKQNNNREAAVPMPVIEKMLGKLEPPQREEAHEVIIYTGQHEF
jgi:predicted kinase